MTRAERNEILRLWDLSVRLESFRRKALLDPAVSVEEYGALAMAAADAGTAAVMAMGGFYTYTLPSLTAWPGAR